MSVTKSLSLQASAGTNSSSFQTTSTGRSRNTNWVQTIYHITVKDPTIEHQFDGMLQITLKCVLRKVFLKSVKLFLSRFYERDAFLSPSQYNFRVIFLFLIQCFLKISKTARVLFNILSSEDSYLDIRNVIQKVNFS